MKMNKHKRLSIQESVKFLIRSTIKSDLLIKQIVDVLHEDRKGFEKHIVESYDRFIKNSNPDPSFDKIIVRMKNDVYSDRDKDLSIILAKEVIEVILNFLDGENNVSGEPDPVYILDNALLKWWEMHLGKPSKIELSKEFGNRLLRSVQYRGIHPIKVDVDHRGIPIEIVEELDTDYVIM